MLKNIALVAVLALAVSGFAQDKMEKSDPKKMNSDNMGSSDKMEKSKSKNKSKTDKMEKDKMEKMEKKPSTKM